MREMVRRERMDECILDQLWLRLVREYVNDLSLETKESLVRNGRSRPSIYQSRLHHSRQQ